MQVMGEISRKLGDEDAVQSFRLPENIYKFSEKAVAIRAGEVVVSANNLEELFQSGELEQTDAIWVVPKRAQHYYGSSQAA